MSQYRNFIPVILFVLLLLAYLWKNVLVVDEIKFIYNHQAIKIQNDVSFLVGQSLLLNDLENSTIKQTILKDELEQSYQVSAIYKVLPNALHVVLQKQQTLYQLIRGEEVFLVDALGLVRKTDQQQADVSTIIINDDFSFVDNQLKASTHQFIKQLIIDLNDVPVEQILYLNALQIELTLKDGKQVILAEDGLSTANIKRLKTLLKELDWQEDFALQSIIDLRFKFPVLK